MADGWRRVDGGEVRWLAERDPDSVTGFDPDRKGPEGFWILNAMYEREGAPSGETYDDRHRRRLASGEVEPLRIGGWSETDAPGLKVPGGTLGWSGDPGPGWRRLRWWELAARTGDPIVPGYPSHRAFPSVKRGGSWPVSIRPPTEGSLDRESFRRLVSVLRGFSGEDATVFAHWCQASLIEYDEHLVCRGLLRDAEALERFDPRDSPSNLWPADRSWVVYTDWDLWGTKVSGPPELLAAIEADDFLETVRLPPEWAGSR